MKILKPLIIFFVLVFIGFFISYADNKYNNEYDKLINAFNSTQASFKFYNIKANAKINKKINKDEMIDICIEIINNLGLEENDIKWERVWNNKEKQIYAQVNNQDKVISISCVKKSDKEAYIMVDILENKVYKSIVDIYTILEDTISKYTNDIEMNTCISGEYLGKLKVDNYNDILKKILYNMNAKEIDRVEEENFVSITAFSKILKEHNLEYFGRKINLNIGMRYSEDDDKTIIYVATPIIKLDY